MWIMQSLGRERVDWILFVLRASIHRLTDLEFWGREENCLLSST